MKEAKSTKTPRNPLSTAAIKGMKPGGKDLSDTGENAGLRVSCGAKGIKSFYYRYRSPLVKGKTVWMTFGYYPVMSLAEARKMLQEFKAIRKSGRCPKAEKDSALRIEQEQVSLRDLEKQKEAFTVTDMVEFYLTQRIEDRIVEGKKIPGARKKKGQAEARRTLYGDAVAVLGDMPAASVTRKHVITMVEKILARGANVQAGNVLRELSSAYEFALGLGRLDDEFPNPALLAKVGLTKAGIKLTSEKATRALNDDEIVELLKWLPGSGFSTVQKNILRFTLWTGCRTGEVCSAAWRDINLEKGTFWIAAPKNGISRTVQLPTQAIQFMKQLKLMTNDYPFPSTRTQLPIQQKSLSEMIWHMKNPEKLTNGRNYKPEQLWIRTIDDWTPHDLRRTVRTGLARLGCLGDVAETLIGHSLGGMKGIYDQHSYHDECRFWIQKWADHLDTIML